MPDSSGKLSDDEKRKIEAWLKEKWKASSVECPISGDNNWIIGEHVVTPMNYTATGFIVGGRVYPQVMLVCRTCGYTIYFNAMFMGLFPSDKEESSGDA